MASITIHESTMSGISWRAQVSQPVSPSVATVSINKRGRHGILSQFCGTWDCASKSWAHGEPHSLPKYLQRLVQKKLEAFHFPPRQPASPNAVPVPIRRRFSGATEAIGNGRMSFPAFLAMELIEAHHLELDLRELPSRA
jgi:hypothetical protein